MTDGAALHYRGNFMYDLVKVALSRMAFGMAEELRPHNVSSVSVTPGFLRSEAMLDAFGVTEENWKLAVEKDPNFLFSETPAFVARGVAALACDAEAMKHSGKALSSWELAKLYEVTDVDGSSPNWSAHAKDAEFGAEQVASHNRFVGGFSDA
jgi:NAD(P)-dependent dehydrogenase (short-subunit alcohol dehydrogenase family)